MTLQAIGKQVIVHKIHEQTRTPVGLYLPSNESKYLLEGHVESVGDDVHPDIVPGCRVVIDRYAGMPVGEDRIALKDTDILAVIQGDTDARHQ